MKMLRLYLFVNAYTQENHDGILHEAFDHGTNVEKLENHGDLHNAVHPEQDDYTAYSLDMHNMHEVHDGTNFLMEDHPEEHPAWNFMEDSAGNKVVEEGNPAIKSQPGLSGKPSTGNGGAFRPVNRGPVQSRSRAGCTSNVPQAQLLANTIIGMISQSNQMMGQLVRMFQIQVVPQPNMMGPFGGNPNPFGNNNPFGRPSGNPFGNPFGPTPGNNPFGRPGNPFGPGPGQSPFGQSPFGTSPGQSPGQSPFNRPNGGFPQSQNPNGGFQPNPNPSAAFSSPAQAGMSLGGNPHGY